MTFLALDRPFLRPEGGSGQSHCATWWPRGGLQLPQRRKAFLPPRLWKAGYQPLLHCLEHSRAWRGPCLGTLKAAAGSELGLGQPERELGSSNPGSTTHCDLKESLPLSGPVFLSGKWSQYRSGGEAAEEAEAQGERGRPDAQALTEV